MTETVYSIVEQCDGKGFNDKFEHLVLDTKRERENLMRDVAYWEKKRAGYQRELEMVLHVSRAVNDSLKRLAEIEGMISAIYQRFSTLPTFTGIPPDSEKDMLHSA